MDAIENKKKEKLLAEKKKNLKKKKTQTSSHLLENTESRKNFFGTSQAASTPIVSMKKTDFNPFDNLVDIREKPKSPKKPETELVEDRGPNVNGNHRTINA